MKKPLKTAAICGIILIAIGLIMGMTIAVYSINLVSESDLTNEDVYSIISQEQFRPIYLASAIISLLIVPFSVIFLYGFAALGKRFNNKHVLTLVYIFIALTILVLMLTIISIFTGDIYPKSAPPPSPKFFSFSSFMENIKWETMNSAIYAPIFRVMGTSDNFFWIFFMVFGLLEIILYAIFGAGIIKLSKNEVPLAAPTGIFYILTPFWPIFGLAANILAIIMFFKSSEKFESKKLNRPITKKITKKTRKR
jgi:hypothetical protein